MKVTETDLQGVLLIEPRSFGDERGYFMETWNETRYGSHKIPRRFVQDNISFSKKGVLRGLHFQNPNPQGKLVSVLQGEVFDVLVDLRMDSPTFKKWWGTNLSSGNRKQVLIPTGFAHGFLVLSEGALFFYKCTEFYSPESELTLLWNDPEIGIKWPKGDPIVSEKDKKGLRLEDIARGRLFKTRS